MSQWDDSENPDNPAAPSTQQPSGDPWTPQELAESQNWANQYYSTHQIPASYGTPDDIANSYVEKRRAGMSHADAMAYLQTVPSLLGWDKYGQKPTNPTPPPTDLAPPGPSTTPAPTAPGAAAAPPPAPYSNAPTFQPPSYTPPPAFSYGNFVAPDPSQLDKDPQYVDTLRREQDAIQRSAAARGVLNTGGTVDDLLRNAKDVASTGYANIFNRDLSTYQANRSNAVDTYNTNYGTQYTDPYKYNYMGAQDVYNSDAHNYDLGQQYSWYSNLFDFQKDQDAWNRKYQLLQLA